MSETFSVMMLDVLRPRFAAWLAENGLMMAHVPDTGPDQYIVVPMEFHFPGPPDDTGGGYSPTGSGLR